MPTLRFPLLGSRVITQGRVMKRPPSSGQHWSTGKSRTLKFSRRITCLQGASLAATVRGKNRPTSASMGSIFSFSSRPSGLLICSRLSMRPATSSRLSTLSASFMRRSLPNWFIRTRLPGYPLTFSNSSAGPPGAALGFGDSVGDFSDLEDGDPPARGCASVRRLYRAP